MYALDVCSSITKVAQAERTRWQTHAAVLEAQLSSAVAAREIGTVGTTTTVAYQQ